MKRFILAAIAAAFAAAPAIAADQPFDLEVIASDQNGVVHYVRNNEDGLSAAMWSDGEDKDSARLTTGADADETYRNALDAADIADSDPGELKMKLFGISIYADEEEGSGSARVVVNAPGGDRSVVVDARDDGPGGDTAHVVINGSDADGAEDFIDDIDDAPRSLKREMKEAVGL
ncbi:MAG: hypothetical protein H2040_07790 [Euryhalocaulis sp.]|uniref:hypothetical protein n=1 Tax=Euryhalocaulis sp. TaxID=2744307 RepID=UPI00182B27AE|nr:hypothetical protein [Euryhalocaulis sp.]MBA4801751.1 hypothetical protein [Euryhalocaulis sp.]